MTHPAASERSSPFTGLLPRSWHGEAGEAHHLLVAPAGELAAPELAAARRLAQLVGRYASEFVRDGADGANPHRIEAATAPAAYVRFVVAVLHDFGPATPEELYRWKRRLHDDGRLDDPRVEAFRRGFSRRSGEDAAGGGGTDVCSLTPPERRRSVSI